MQCPKCGYVMGEWETECLRCRRAGGDAPAVTPPAPAAPAVREEEKECPRCGKATPAGTTLCDKCGYEYQPEGGRAERYQALVAEEARAAAPSALRRTVPPFVSWLLIAVCLLAMGGVGWKMFGGLVTGQDYEDSDIASPVALMARHRAPHAGTAITVTYKVTGTVPQAVVAYRGADGVNVAPPEAVALPWTQALKFKSGASLALSAKPTVAGGTVTAEIDVDGVPRKQAATPGANGLTSVSATL